MNALIKCFKLAKYGNQAKLSRISGIVCIVSALLLFAAGLSGGDNPAFFSGYFMGMGIFFIYQPLLTIAYKKQLDSSPLRKTATVTFMSLMLFVSSALSVIIYTLIGGIASFFLPEAVRSTVFAMTATVMLTAAMGISSLLPKFSGVAYGLLFILDCLMISFVVNSGGIISEWFLQCINSIPLCAGVCLLFSALAAALTYALLNLFYKKTYNKIYQGMAAAFGD